MARAAPPQKQHKVPAEKPRAPRPARRAPAQLDTASPATVPRAPPTPPASPDAPPPPADEGATSPAPIAPAIGPAPPPAAQRQMARPAAALPPAPPLENEPVSPAATDATWMIDDLAWHCAASDGAASSADTAHDACIKLEPPSPLLTSVGHMRTASMPALVAGGGKKRMPMQAPMRSSCESCRLARRGCDGSAPCSRCRAKGIPCLRTTRKKAGQKGSWEISPEEYLERQRRAALPRGASPAKPRPRARSRTEPGVKPDPDGSPASSSAPDTPAPLSAPPFPAGAPELPDAVFESYRAAFDRAVADRAAFDPLSLLDPSAAAAAAAAATAYSYPPAFMPPNPLSLPYPHPSPLLPRAASWPSFHPYLFPSLFAEHHHYLHLGMPGMFPPPVQQQQGGEEMLLPEEEARAEVEALEAGLLGAEYHML
ncbi:hypothetical protein DFJ74DRAFT_734141 [Hyaloraphidium curvatum]|nr:hypothetical protein DFJ74DRAFT_734141 [Hyaloraphidium curvatum]